MTSHPASPSAPKARAPVDWTAHHHSLVSDFIDQGKSRAAAVFFLLTNVRSASNFFFQLMVAGFLTQPG